MLNIANFIDQSPFGGINFKTMTIQEVKEIYRAKARIYNGNLIYIRRQANRQELMMLKQKYNTTDDSQLAKLLMLNGIQLGS